MSRWKTIAKSEIRRGTSRFRKHRTWFFVIIYSIIIFWALFLAPFLIEMLIMPAVESISTWPVEILQQAVALVIEYLLMAFFLMIMVYPINTVFRKTEIGFKELILASPVSAGDIFIGEFFGKIPIYIAGVLIFAPIITGLINPLVSLTFFQYLIIYGCIIGLVVFAILIGNIIASFLEHKIAKSEKARDLGKVLMFLVGIGMVVLIYSLEFFFQYLMENPQLKNWLMFHPALWYSNIILYSINPIFISSYLLNIWSSAWLAIFIPFLVLYIAYKKADAFFTLEGGIEKFSSIIEKEGAIYKLVRKVTPRDWSGLVVTQLKEFFRKKENIMKLIYVIGLVGFMAILYMFLSDEGLNAEAKSIFSITIIWMAGMMFSIIIGNFIFVGSKDIVWIYKRSPRGIKTLISSYLFAQLFPVIIIDIILTIFISIVYQYDLFSVVFFFVFYLIQCMTSLSEAIGLQAYMPSYEEKGRQMSINVFLLVILQILPFFLGIFVFIFIFPSNLPPALLKIALLTPMILISVGLAAILLYFGIKKLNKLE